MRVCVFRVIHAGWRLGVLAAVILAMGAAPVAWGEDAHAPKPLARIFGKASVTRSGPSAGRPVAWVFGKRSVKSKTSDNWTPPQRVTPVAAVAASSLPPLPRFEGDAPPIAYVVQQGARPSVVTNAAGVLAFDLNALRATGAASQIEPVAMAAITASPARSRNNAAALMAQAVSAFRGGEATRALTLIRQAALLDPENPSIAAAMAEILMQTRAYPDALRAYETALRLADIQAMRDRYLSRYAVALYLQGDRNRAMEALDGLLPSRPGARVGSAAYGAYLVLGTLRQQAGQPESAIPALEIAVALNPDSSLAHYNLGLAYEMTGRAQQAKAHYQRAHTLNPASQEAQLALERLQSPS